MKFRFCGDADCPDWLLMQINSLSSLDSTTLEKLCQHIVLSFFDEELNYMEIESLTKGSLFDANDVKACLSAVRQVLASAGRHGVTRDELTAELQQLGLEATRSSAIGDVYQQHSHRLTLKLKNESIRIARMKDVEVERIEAGNELLMKMSVLDETSETLERKAFTFTRDQASLLLHDLKKLQVRMREFQPKSEN